jgi:hypothetical protein
MTKAAETTPVDRLYQEVQEMCRAYCDKHGCGPSTLGRVALKDSLFIKRVLDGESVTTDKMRKLEQFLLSNPASPKEIMGKSPTLADAS